MIYHKTFRAAINGLNSRLVHQGRRIDVGHWQGVPTEGRPDLTTVEVLNVSFACPMPPDNHDDQRHIGILDLLRAQIMPNLPWADDHFAERVSRNPSNPGVEYLNWPWWRGQTDKTQRAGVFDHTYQERYWPKHAGKHRRLFNTELGKYENFGIRYEYGDLDDVVGQLLEYPYSRQAYLPIFFPEDTGNVHRGRVPCTLGYHFMLRDGKLHMWYFIRSCDFVRHFRDDLYLSARLLLWVLEELVERELRGDSVGQVWVDVDPGDFTFVCPSLHYHRGDEHLVR